MGIGLLALLMTSMMLESCGHTPGKISEIEQQRLDSLSVLSKELRAKGKAIREETANLEVAISYHTQALDCAIQAKDTLSIALCYNQLGSNFRRLGKLEESLRYHRESVRYLEEYSDTSSVHALHAQSIITNGLGNVLLMLGFFDDAEQCFRKSLLQVDCIGVNNLGRAQNYSNLGSVFLGKNQYDSARFYYNNALVYDRICDSSVGVAYCYFHLGEVDEKERRYADALEKYREAYIYIRDTPNEWHKASYMHSMARMHVLLNHYDSAYHYCQSTIEVAERISSYEFLSKSYRLLSTYHEHYGRYEQSVKCFNKSEEYGAMINTDENLQRISEISLNYEQQKRKEEIEAMRAAFESEKASNRKVRMFFIALLVCVLIAMGGIHYASLMHRRRLQIMRKYEQVRSTFFNNLTHEFHTPITVIIGLIDQLLVDELDSERRHHYFTTISRQGHQLLDLVNQLLGISRIMAGKGPDALWRHGDVTDYARLCLSSYNDYARLSNVQMTIDSPEYGIEMDFVPEYFDKIFRNLLSNAFKYTPMGGQIGVQLRKESGRFLLDVTNSGSHVKEEELELIFELFYMGTNSSKKAGTGLGLPYVRQMVESMGGTIKACNLPGNKGVQFSMSMPLISSSAPKPVPKWDIAAISHFSQSDSPVASSDIERSDKNLPLVLVVEDNGDILEYISLLLHPYYNVMTASQVDEAINKIERAKPDLIITDLRMPEIDGSELVIKVRNTPSLKDLPVIVVSADTTQMERVMSSEVGASAFIAKPFNSEDLIAKIQKLIEVHNFLQTTK